MFAEPEDMKGLTRFWRVPLAGLLSVKIMGFKKKKNKTSGFLEKIRKLVKYLFIQSAN